MRTVKRVFYGLFLIMLVFGLAYSGNQNKAGTTAAPHLLIPIGAKYLGYGGSAVAIASGLESIYWNPAGVDLVKNSANAIFSYRSWLADMSVSYFAVSGKFGFGSVGLALKVLDVGDIPVTTELDPDGTGAVFSPTYFVGTLTYSKRLTDRISVGANLNIAHESWAQVSATGFAFDAGVQYHGLFKIPGLSLGVVIKNIGFPVRYDGSALWVEAEVPGTERGVTWYKVQAAEFEMPSVIELGVAYQFNVGENNNFRVVGAFQNNNFAYDEYRVGLEYSFRDVLSLRAGYLLSPESGRWIPSPDVATPNIFQNFSFGAGVNLGNVAGLALEADYAFVPVKFFGNNHVISVSIGF